MTLVLSIAMISVIAQANNILIENQHASEQWWLAFYVRDADDSCGGEITNVEIKGDPTHTYYNEWRPYSKYEWGFYDFDASLHGPALTLPISVRITRTNGETTETLTAHNVITSFGVASFDFGSNFCSAPQPPSAPPTAPPTNPAINPCPPLPSPAFTDPVCVGAIPSNFEWSSDEHKIKLNGQIIKIKGLSWFGADGEGYAVAGLANWHGNGGHSYLWYFDLIQSQGFNAIRLPFSQFAVLNNPPIEDWAISTQGNEIFTGKTHLEGLDIIIDEAATRGILIMLDSHSISPGQGGTDEFFDAANQGILVWNMMAERYTDRWNVFMIDVFNEPWDVSNSQWTTYRDWCQTVGDDIINFWGVNWLIAVQGTNPYCFLRAYTEDEEDWESNPYCYWGENLQQVDSYPVELNESNRVVYIPHVFGPSLTESSGLFNIVYSADIWYDHWAYIRTSNVISSAVFPGEWGSSYSAPNRKAWMDAFVAYLISIDTRDNFFWCLNADSSDTGGILESDWDTLECEKLEKLHELQPNPTVFVYDSNTNTVCWE